MNLAFGKVEEFGERLDDRLVGGPTHGEGGYGDLVDQAGQVGHAGTLGSGFGNDTDLHKNKYSGDSELFNFFVGTTTGDDALAGLVLYLLAGFFGDTSTLPGDLAVGRHATRFFLFGDFGSGGLGKHVEY